MSNKNKVYKIYGEEVNSTLYKTYYWFHRRMRYYEEDIKTEKVHVDLNKQKVMITPSKEDSYERLLNFGIEFEDKNQLSVEDEVEFNLLKLELHKIILQLSEIDRYIIYGYYFYDLNEEQIANHLDISQSAVSQRKNRILRDLKYFFKKI